MLEADLITAVKADSGVTALLGNGDEMRFFPALAPEGAGMPYAIFARTDTPARVQATDGPTGYAIATVEIEAWSDRYLSACTVIEAFRKCLDGFRNTAGIENIDAVGPSDLYNEESQLYGRHMEFRIQYHED